jgi:phage FluMu protein Com
MMLNLSLTYASEVWELVAIGAALFFSIVACRWCSKARVTASGSGALTIYCGSCKFQGFAKSPKAVSALQAKIGGASAEPPAGQRPADKKGGAGQGGGGFLDDL